MGATAKTRKVEYFTLHAHTSEGALKSYYDFFVIASKALPFERCDEKWDRLVGLPIVQLTEDSVFFVAVEGPKGESPLIYNAKDASMRVEKLAKDEISGTRTHGIINLKTREAAIEFNHRGAKVIDIEGIFDKIGRAHVSGSFSLSFNPKVKEAFAKEIERFDRIRAASIKLRRPNFDWTDSKEQLDEVAKASNAHTIALEVTAGRNQSLDKNTGIIGVLKHALASLKSATVTGTRAGESVETTVTSSKHTEHSRISLNINQDGQVNLDDVDAKLRQLVDCKPLK